MGNTAMIKLRVCSITSLWQIHQTSPMHMGDVRHFGTLDKRIIQIEQDQ